MHKGGPWGRLFLSHERLKMFSIHYAILFDYFGQIIDNSVRKIKVRHTESDKTYK